MKLDPKIVEAAERFKFDEGGSGTHYVFTNEEVARHVILALADNLPAKAVNTALDTFLKENPSMKPNFQMRPMKNAIIAALKDIAGETP